MRRLERRLGAGGLVGDGTRLLRYGRGVDNRRLREEIGYAPRRDAAAAIGALARADRARRIAPSLHPAAIADRLTGARP